MLTIEKLLDDGEYVFTRNPDLSFITIHKLGMFVWFDGLSLTTLLTR